MSGSGEVKAVWAVGLISVACDIFFFVFVIFIGQGIVFYETDKRKTKENYEILAHKLHAGKWTRPIFHGYVCFIDADLRVVGYRGSLVPKSKW